MHVEQEVINAHSKDIQMVEDKRSAFTYAQTVPECWSALRRIGFQAVSLVYSCGTSNRRRH